MANRVWFDSMNGALVRFRPRATVAVITLVFAFIPAAVTYAQESRTFGGFDCTDDCSGHAAGYNWAQSKSITDESDCGGDSNSFTEGCQVYVREPSRGADEDDDGNEIEQQ